MGRIPVGRTIAETYAFAFRHYFSILGVVWLPLLIFCAAGYYIFIPALSAMSAALSDIAQHTQPNPQVPYLPAAFGESLRGIFLFEFVALLLMPVLAVGVTKVAFKMPRGLPFVYLAIGKRELLVLGGLFTLLALYLGAVVVMAVVGAIVGIIAALVMGGTSAGDPAEAAATTTRVVQIVVPLIYLGLSYFFVRLAFLMVPVTTTENRFGVWRSWQLTKGNFWRSLGVILGTFLPLTIVFYAIWYVILGPAIFQYWWHAQTRPDLAATDLATLMQALTHQLLAFGIYVLVVSPISYGLMFGQSAFAYRALTGGDTQGERLAP